jgi:hypothetical protein
MLYACTNHILTVFSLLPEGRKAAGGNGLFISYVRFAGKKAKIVEKFDY